MTAAAVTSNECEKLAPDLVTAGGSVATVAAAVVPAAVLVLLFWQCSARRCCSFLRGLLSQCEPKTVEDHVAGQARRAVVVIVQAAAEAAAAADSICWY